MPTEVTKSALESQRVVKCEFHLEVKFCRLDFEGLAGRLLLCQRCICCHLRILLLRKKMDKPFLLCLQLLLGGVPRCTQSRVRLLQLLHAQNLEICLHSRLRPIIRRATCDQNCILGDFVLLKHLRIRFVRLGPALSNVSTPDSITMHNHVGARVPISNLSPALSCRLLGFCQASFSALDEYCCLVSLRPQTLRFVLHRLVGFDRYQ